MPTKGRAWVHLQVLHRNVQRFRGRLVFKAHRRCVSLNSRLERNTGEDTCRRAARCEARERAAALLRSNRLSREFGIYNAVGHLHGEMYENGEVREMGLQGERACAFFLSSRLSRGGCVMFMFESVLSM